MLDEFENPGWWFLYAGNLRHYGFERSSGRAMRMWYRFLMINYRRSEGVFLPGNVLDAERIRPFAARTITFRMAGSGDRK
jgi:hypothetical protein